MLRINKSERPIIRMEIKRKKMCKVQLDLLFSESDYIDRKMHSSIKSSNSYLALVGATDMGALLFSVGGTPFLSGI
jgi:hypothetical protein